MLNLHFNSFPVIATERLLLRSISMKDAESLFQLRKNIDVMRYIDRPRATSIEMAHEVINKMENNYVNQEGIGWGIELKKENGLIGTIGYHRIEKEHYRAEIGYLLDPNHWNKGIMSEAITKVLDFGFHTMKLHSIEAKVNPDNNRSIQLLQKHNFFREAYFKENYFYEGIFLDTAVYSLIKKPSI